MQTRRLAQAATTGILVMAQLSCAWGKEPAAVAGKPAADVKPKIQIALLLDTSNSMDGLIEQAKLQLWKVVNDFARAKRGGQKPELEVALYHYGTPSLGAENGYIKQLMPLSTDLDKISEELFKLRTNGGDEYCGAVVGKATEELKWSPARNDYKAIFIAGNEPFNQGTVGYAGACKAAISKGIVVNTIFCGSQDEGLQTQWKDGADLADGLYMNIDQNQKVVQLSAPQDKELVEWNAKLNSTYVAYGASGKGGRERQASMDAAATAAPAVAAERAVAKSSAFYRNEAWDLVDAVKADRAKLKDLKDEELPEEMLKLAPEKRQEYVETKARERAAIQEQIGKLAKEREAFLASERNRQAAGATNTLDSALLNAIHTQAGKLKFEF